MIPAPFEYVAPSTVEEAISVLNQVGEDAKVLAGGHSLIPAMKFRLAQPKTVIDLGRIPQLKNIRIENGGIAIGALATHYAVESSALLKEKCPLLPEVATEVGDVQVRNRGTIGGSVVHADPAADWPAGLLALDAEFEIAGPTGRRTVPAAEFFVDMMQTAVQLGEILVAIKVPTTKASVSYVKFTQKASGFAIAGVAVVVNASRRSVRVGVTGVAAVPYRAKAVEGQCEGRALDRELIYAAATRAAADVEPLGDIHASAEYRAHLAVVNTQRALECALARS